MSAGERVLVVGPSWVGDMVMAQAMLRRLVDCREGVEIDVVAPVWSLPLLQRMSEVRSGVALDVGHGQLGLAKRFRLGRALAGRSYTQAIVLPRSLKAALVPYFARIPRRTGFRGEYRYGLLNDIRPFDPTVLDQTVKRFVALAASGAAEELPQKLAEPELTTDPANLSRLKRVHALTDGAPVVALMPGAEYGPAKQWPVERFGALAQRLAEDGVSIWIIGSAKEAQTADEIARAGASARVHNLCGKTELTDAVDLLSAADVAVTNDSGLMHVAAAVGTHVLAIYGSSTPDFTPPLTQQQTIFYERIACSPCFERHCPLGHLDCLRSISAEAVELAVRRVLNAQAGAGSDSKDD